MLLVIIVGADYPLVITPTALIRYFNIVIVCTDYPLVITQTSAHVKSSPLIAYASQMADKNPKRILTPKEMETVGKMSTTRLTRNLMNIGTTDEEIDLMDRDHLVRAWVAAVAEGRDRPITPNPTETAAAIAGFDRIKFEREMQLKEQELRQQQDHMQHEKELAQ